MGAEAHAPVCDAEIDISVLGLIPLSFWGENPMFFYIFCPGHVLGVNPHRTLGGFLMIPPYLLLPLGSNNSPLPALALENERKNLLPTPAAAFPPHSRDPASCNPT